MRNLLLLAAVGLATANAFADANESTERTKITGFHCDSGRAVIELRSLDRDRALYLAKANEGEPQVFWMLEHQCQGLTKNLGQRLQGQILDLVFRADTVTRKERVWIPPRDHCRTKCDNDGAEREVTVTLTRTETMIDGLRFFSEERKGR